MRVIVTCGPSCEPIDQVRFLSNFSTGELGALLTQALQERGFEVICLRSRLATYPMHNAMSSFQKLTDASGVSGVYGVQNRNLHEELEELYTEATVQCRATTELPKCSAAQVIPFTTNTELAALLKLLSTREPIAALFHAAALCDYRVEKIASLSGGSLSAGKISTDAGPLEMTLMPTIKVISVLRQWFPNSLLLGWKYEVDGTKKTATMHVEDQIKKYQLDASIANGPVFANAFQFISTAGVRKSFDSKNELSLFLATWAYKIIAKT